MSELAIKDFVKDPAPFEKVINYIVYEKSQMSGNDTVNAAIKSLLMKAKTPNRSQLTAKLLRKSIVPRL